MDDVDREIVRLLRLNARRTNAELAAEIGLSPSACLRRVRLLEGRGIILGYSAIVSASSGEQSLTVIVQVTLERQTEEYLARFEAAVRQHPEIRECYLVAGDVDYWLRVSIESSARYEALHMSVLSRLPGVMRLNTSFAMRDALQPSRKTPPRR